MVTFAAPAESVGEAAIRGVEAGGRSHRPQPASGVHPRIGAADVVPFVPVEGVTLAGCVKIAGVRRRRDVAPLAPRRSICTKPRRGHPDRVNLANIRRGQFEGLREEVRTNPAAGPISAKLELHPTAGATVVGARKFLIAYNINLKTSDLEIAKRIAAPSAILPAGCPYVKAMGVPLGVAQPGAGVDESHRFRADADASRFRGRARGGRARRRYDCRQ